jgi:5S rRNA maturation endonuclease (ribonuclease M5)
MRHGEESEELEKWLEKLEKSGKLVIVEGKKDRKSLHALGTRNVYSMDRKPVYKVVEEVAAMARKAVILTDLDAEGKKLFGKLNSGLQYHGVEVDNYFREWLFRNTKLRQLEGLKSYFEKLRGEREK